MMNIMIFWSRIERRRNINMISRNTESRWVRFVISFVFYRGYWSYCMDSGVGKVWLGWGIGLVVYSDVFNIFKLCIND